LIYTTSYNQSLRTAKHTCQTVVYIGEDLDQVQLL